MNQSAVRKLVVRKVLLLRCRLSTLREKMVYDSNLPENNSDADDYLHFILVLIFTPSQILPGTPGALLRPGRNSVCDHPTESALERIFQLLALHSRDLRLDAGTEQRPLL